MFCVLYFQEESLEWHKNNKNYYLKEDRDQDEAESHSVAQSGSQPPGLAPAH